MVFDPLLNEHFVENVSAVALGFCDYVFGAPLRKANVAFGILLRDLFLFFFVNDSVIVRQQL